MLEGPGVRCRIGGLFGNDFLARSTSAITVKSRGGQRTTIRSCHFKSSMGGTRSRIVTLAIVRSAISIESSAAKLGWRMYLTLTSLDSSSGLASSAVSSALSLASALTAPTDSLRT